MCIFTDLQISFHQLRLRPGKGLKILGKRPKDYNYAGFDEFSMFLDVVTTFV